MRSSLKVRSSGDASTLQRGAAQHTHSSTPQRYADAARLATPSQISSDFIFGHFTSSRTCATMLTRAVSEGDAARPITASHLRRACKTGKHSVKVARPPIITRHHWASSRGDAMKRSLLVLAIAACAAIATPSKTSARLSDLIETTQAQPNYAQYYYGPYRRHVRRVYRRAYRRAYYGYGGYYPYSYGGYSPYSYGGYYGGYSPYSYGGYYRPSYFGRWY
jgi:hypothetical protein